MEKDKKITFTKEIDSMIEGLALGIAFVAVGLLVWFGGVFHNSIVNIVITIILLFIGICGTLLEIDKVRKNDIKGLGEFLGGGIFTALSLFVIIKLDWLILNILFLVVFLFSVDVMFMGVFKIFYSLKIKRRKVNDKKSVVIKFITVATEVVALVVVVLQLISELGKTML